LPVNKRKVMIYNIDTVWKLYSKRRSRLKCNVIFQTQSKIPASSSVKLAVLKIPKMIVFIRKMEIRGLCSNSLEIIVANREVYTSI
jgi:hypothetical protein